MPSELTKLNGFNKNPDGVYCAIDKSLEFNYSDGSEAEKLLKKILTGASDLQSDSPELDAAIVDWPSEYHLSSVRANLLRCLDLTGVTKVLELGCGCGSISRYLGEQTHLQVDSIEGSPARAALAALRCKDLENVTISCGNFNEIEFVADYYDLILFVGVTEYAGRFSEQTTDQAALQDLLALAKRASKDDGVTLIAIENRTGLKYMLGAAEDHYGVPYVGLQDYPASTGIRTYTKTQWQQQIKQSGYKVSQFLYPFPDYKIPTLVLHEKAILEEASREKLLNVSCKIESRDYLSQFQQTELEPNLWRGLLEAGTFSDHANSFMILLSDNSTRINEMSNFEIREFAIKKFAARYVPQITSSANSNTHSNSDLKKKVKKQTVHKRNNLAKEQRINELQGQLNLIHQSRAWRYLERIRPVLRVLGIGRK